MSALLPVVAGSLLLLAPPGWSAQAPPPSREAPREAADGRMGREAAFRMVDAYIVANLQESLGLDDETYAKAVPLVKALQSARRDYFLDRGKALRDLRGLLRSGSATRDEVIAALDAVKKIDADGPDRMQAASAALDAVLSPMEQAKYRVLELEVEHRMRDLMGRARRDHSRPRDPKR